MFSGVRRRERLVAFNDTERNCKTMARLFHAKGTRPRRLTAGVVTLGAAAATMIALVTSGGVASAAPVYSAYSVNVTGAGLNLNLFGNKLAGGNSFACANYGPAASQQPNKDGNGNATACDSSKGGAPYMSYAQGEGTLLTTGGLHGLETSNASEGSPSGSTVNGTVTSSSKPQSDGFVCSQLSSGGFQGSGGVGLDLGVSCANATSSLDAVGYPKAEATGDVVHLGVDIDAVLAGLANGGSASTGASDLCNQASGQGGQQVGQLFNGLCQALTSIGGGASSAPPPIGGLFNGIAQALQNLRDVATKDNVPCPLYPSASAPASVCIEVGPAQSNIATAGDGTVTATSLGETIEIDVLPGVGCTAGTSLLTCATNDATYLTAPGGEASNPTAAPLITVNVGPASCTETLDPTTAKWTTSSYASIVDIHLNIPGDNITVPIPGATGQGQTFAQGTPLQGTIRIADASSAAPVGDSAGCSGDSLTLSLLENTQFPGGSTTPGQGAINVSLGNSNAGANVAGVAPATTSNGSPPPGPGPGPGLPPVATAAATSPTAVHTGEWWSGSLPLLAILAALGGGLIGWPRLRRLPMVARLVTRSSR